MTLRVLPHSAGYYEALAVGPFVVLDFPRVDDVVMPEPTTVYVEELYLDKPAETIRYTTVFADLEDGPLDEQGSRDLILRCEGDRGPPVRRARDRSLLHRAG